ncbi:MAG TPA: hypothetical protein VG406_11865 [Isosphaeraceae bacterium]|jgi:hypothetical protein|nr:hypothetical protein [Isosphaeraceae bacterium]
MRLSPTRRAIVPLALAIGALLMPARAHAGKLSWLDDVVRRVVRDAEAEERVAARSVERSASRSSVRFFVRESDESLEVLARRADDLARAGRRLDQPAESVLESRFARLVRAEPEAMGAYRALKPAEKRLVVEMGETARRLARRYPDQAEPLIRKLGVEGLTAARVYGDDVAEVLAKEGPEGLTVLRKTGRGGWKFYTEQVLAHKKKLAAAGVLALFLANPDKFVDSAGRVTEYAVEQFSKAGIRLAGALGDGAARGLESTLGAALASHGLEPSLARKGGMALAAVVAFLAAMVLLGLPVRLAFRPFTWPFRLLGRRRRTA